MRHIKYILAAMLMIAMEAPLGAYQEQLKTLKISQQIGQKKQKLEFHEDGDFLVFTTKSGHIYNIDEAKAKELIDTVLSASMGQVLLDDTTNTFHAIIGKFESLDGKTVMLLVNYERAIKKINSDPKV